MKKNCYRTISKILVICTIIASIFLFTACGNNSINPPINNSINPPIDNKVDLKYEYTDKVIDEGYGGDNDLYEKRPYDLKSSEDIGDIYLFNIFTVEGDYPSNKIMENDEIISSDTIKLPKYKVVTYCFPKMLHIPVFKTEKADCCHPGQTLHLEYHIEGVKLSQSKMCDMAVDIINNNSNTFKDLLSDVTCGGSFSKTSIPEVNKFIGDYFNKSETGSGVINYYNEVTNEYDYDLYYFYEINGKFYLAVSQIYEYKYIVSESKLKIDDEKSFYSYKYNKSDKIEFLGRDIRLRYITNYYDTMAYKKNSDNLMEINRIYIDYAYFVNVKFNCDDDDIVYHD